MVKASHLVGGKIQGFVLPLNVMGGTQHARTPGSTVKTAGNPGTTIPTPITGRGSAAAIARSWEGGCGRWNGST
jgi:hypothetical protein